MRYKDDDEAKLLNAEQWQLDLLRANPPYCGWGPHEDYMWKTGEGWDSRQIVATWAAFGPWKLDDLNECAGFYFDVSRASEQCKTCGGNGYHPKAQGVVNTFYSHMNPAGESWYKNITQDEVQALVDSGRLIILTEARLKRLGLPVLCPSCDGRGETFTEPAAHVSLVLWWLHPRKGCSRGIEVTRIERGDLPAVRAFLVAAADRNAMRFAGALTLPSK